MKGSCTLVASALAASTVALASSSTACHHHHASNPSPPKVSWISSSSLSSPSSVQSDVTGLHTSSSNKEKFAPRFDGLRFIETLVTAHR
ncbi:uncharacterized protein LOC131315845 isoform X1 [Rhododendron vialii]|uniref:uncharacterized protein LOC131315845 isoform X1 n=1 Tax=Rhododendron vialii TaxID=182163 RepID=UPI0026600252|nr:uncharacterized protein LOC131315845 isoform X1 [Rhododendron vialii]